MGTKYAFADIFKINFTEITKNQNWRLNKISDMFSSDENMNSFYNGMTFTNYSVRLGAKFP